LKIKAILFDRDGVLFDSETAHIRSIIETLKHYGIDAKEERLSFIFGMHPLNYKEHFLELFNVPWREYRDVQRKKFYKILESGGLIFNETINLAKQLKEKKFAVGLVTSARKETTDQTLKFIGLENFFDIIITREDSASHKPSPEPYLLASQKIGFNPEECLVFEDSANGVESAKNAGMKVVGLRTNKFFEQDFSKADLVLEQNEICFEKIKDLLR